MKVEPILGRPFVWHVDSQSEPGKQHTVSWVGDSMDNGPVCTCRSFAMKNRQHKIDTGRNFICFHLRAAKDHAWDEMIETVRDNLLAQ